MNTFLLYWNPFFSSYKLDRIGEDFDFNGSFYENCLVGPHDANRLPDDFDWSIFEHGKAHSGDKFYFIRVGYEKPTGLVGSGVFTSEPFHADDWSGQGRNVFYMKMAFSTFVNPISDKVLPTEKLSAAIPEIDWTKGKAGVMVTPEVAERIEALWSEHIEANCIKGKRRE